MRENDNWCSSQCQFGFKKMVSTTQCSHAVNEIINYYNFKKTNIHMLFLDTSKAFDRVRYCKLFKCLLKHNLYLRLLRLLPVMYTQQQLNVKWKARIGNYFNVSNGVKQGGVLSPTLFAVYVDDLLQKFKKNSGVGCYVSITFVRAVSYDNGIILLALLSRC